MAIRSRGLLILLAFVFVLTACGSKVAPEEQLKEIEVLMAKDFTMTQDQFRDVMRHRETGKRLMRQGKPRAASKSFVKAIEILHEVRDSRMHTKTD